jgi:hypothetical protein
MAYLTPAKNRPARQRNIAASLDRESDSFDGMVDRILECFDRADDATVAYGLGWYRRAHDICQDLAELYCVPFETVVAVMAVLSPSCGWARNVALTESMLATGDCSHPHGANTKKARRILAGESLDDVVACGRKVRNFYRCILDPDRSGACTVDRHAVVLATGLAFVALDGYLDRIGVYLMVAAAYRTAGRILGLSGAAVQAVTWTQHRIETGADRFDTLV